MSTLHSLRLPCSYVEVADGHRTPLQRRAHKSTIVVVHDLFFPRIDLRLFKQSLSLPRRASFSFAAHGPRRGAQG